MEDGGAGLDEAELARLRAIADALCAPGEEGCVVILGTASDDTRALAEAELIAAIADRRDWRPILLDRWVPEPMSHIAAWSAGVRRTSVFSIAGWGALAAAAPQALGDALTNLAEAHDVLSHLRVVHWIDAGVHDAFRGAELSWASARVHHWIETDADRASGRPSLAGLFDTEDTPPTPDFVHSLLEVVALARGGPPEDLAAALLTAASAWRDAGSPSHARPLYEEALPLLRDAGDARGHAACLRGVGEAMAESGDDAGAAQYLEEARAAFAAAGDPDAAAECAPVLARVWERLGDRAMARALFEEAASSFELAGAQDRAEEYRREAERLA